jgi:hypothetical protein
MLDERHILVARCKGMAAFLKFLQLQSKNSASLLTAGF